MDDIVDDWMDEDLSYLPYEANSNENTEVNIGSLELVTPVHPSDNLFRNSLYSDLSVSNELPPEFISLFPFSHFNKMQSDIFSSVYHTNANIVCGAPAGSGKTVIFELAMLRLLSKKSLDHHNTVTIYIAPLKALVHEKYAQWKKQFSKLGFSCVELTSDTEYFNTNDIKNSSILCTTPEKFAYISLRWREHQPFMDNIGLLLVDEIHLLNEKRGACLEGLIARMNAMHSAKCKSGLQPHSLPIMNLRIIAASATITNIQDIADWLNAISCIYGDEMRPVKLDLHVISFPQRKNDYLFDVSLNYHLLKIIRQYSDEKSTLIFCSTKKGTLISAKTIIQEIIDTKSNFLIRDNEHIRRLFSAALSFNEKSLQEIVRYGIGIHNADLLYSDREKIEEMFSSGELRVICATSTLSQGKTIVLMFNHVKLKDLSVVDHFIFYNYKKGVNFPAHLVIIKGTKVYERGKGFVDISKNTLRQMIGRAGRPQFDSYGTAVIMTDPEHNKHYQDIVHGYELIESNLMLNLIENINAEIVLDTVTNISTALEWIKNTFLFHRIKHNPRRYKLNLSSISDEQVENYLKELMLNDIKKLSEANFIEIADDQFVPRLSSKLMAKYSLKFQTMQQINALEFTNTEEFLQSLSKFEEYKDIQIRQGEKKVLNELIKKNKIRYPLKGRVKEDYDKIFVLIQVLFHGHKVEGRALIDDIQQLLMFSFRILSAAIELFIVEKTDITPIIEVIELSKCFSQKMWPDSNLISKQLEGIGPTKAQFFSEAGVNTVQQLEKLSYKNISSILRVNENRSREITYNFSIFPHYEIEITELGTTQNILSISVNQAKKNYQKSRREKSHSYYLIIGQNKKKLLAKKMRILNSGLSNNSVRIVLPHSTQSVTIHILDSTYFGVDLISEYFLQSNKDTMPGNIEKPLSYIKEQNPTKVSPQPHFDESHFQHTTSLESIEKYLIKNKQNESDKNVRVPRNFLANKGNNSEKSLNLQASPNMSPVQDPFHIKREIFPVHINLHNRETFEDTSCSSKTLYRKTPKSIKQPIGEKTGPAVTNKNQILDEYSSEYLQNYYHSTVPNVKRLITPTPRAYTGDWVSSISNENSIRNHFQNEEPDQINYKKRFKTANIDTNNRFSGQFLSLYPKTQVTEKDIKIDNVENEPVNNSISPTHKHSIATSLSRINNETSFVYHDDVFYNIDENEYLFQ